VHAELGCSSA